LDNNIWKEENCKRKFNGGKNHTEPFQKRHHSSESIGNGNSHRHGGHFTRAMVATSMATGTMEDSRETTPMATITMVITMGEMDIAVSTPMLRRISPTSPATSARIMGIIPPTTQKISQMMQPSPIHSKRDR
jgi:hypothetical protein